MSGIKLNQRGGKNKRRWVPQTWPEYPDTPSSQKLQIFKSCETINSTLFHFIYDGMSWVSIAKHSKAADQYHDPSFLWAGIDFIGLRSLGSGWRGDPEFNSIDCSTREPGFNSQHPRGSSQSSVIPVSEDLTCFWSLWTPDIHMMHSHICRQISVHINF